MVLMTVLALAGCGRGSQAIDANAPAAKTSSKATGDHVTLSADEQQQGGIEISPAIETTQPQQLRVSGHIVLADNHTWRVGIRTDGVVVSLQVGVGDHVRQGQVLARYHADEVRDSRARYRAAQAELAKARSGAALAQRNVDRAETLLELKAGSQVQLEQTRQDLAAAQAAASTAEAEVERLKDLLEDDLRVPAEPTPDDPNADAVPILAPASGYVLEKNVTLGRAVHTDDDTFVIGDLSQVWMLASVRQDQLGLLRVGAPATVTLTGATPVSFPGTVANLGQELDATTRTMQVRVVVDNKENQLRPEMLATAAIPIGGARPAVLVPADSVQQVDGQDVVFVRVAADRFAVRPIRAGATSNGQTTIVEGVKAGEPVVARGSFAVKSQLLRASLQEGE
jgi:cobalt-zinc-cadmium efflux system membrane fusion protein